jgi:hypothetical protein
MLGRERTCVIHESVFWITVLLCFKVWVSKWLVAGMAGSSCSTSTIGQRCPLIPPFSARLCPFYFDDRYPYSEYSSASSGNPGVGGVRHCCSHIEVGKELSRSQSHSVFEVCRD